MTDLNLANYQTVWADSFSDPKNCVFGNHWGPGVDLSTPGQITLHTTADNQDSGTMQQSSGASSNQGYGLYSETLQMQGTIGVYGMAGWPASDHWPGPELDMVEVLADGTPYASVHWKGADGSDQDQSVMFKGVDVTQAHNYQMDWQADHVSFYVDGKEMGTVTDHVPLDYAHGGENESMGIGVQTSWNSGALGGNNWVTITDASYSKFVGGATPPAAASTTTVSSTGTAPASSDVSASATDPAVTATTPATANSPTDTSTTGTASTPSSVHADAGTMTPPSTVTTDTVHSSTTTDAPSATTTSGATSPTTSAGTTTPSDPTTTSNTFDFANLKHDHGSHGGGSFHFSDLSNPATATASATSADTTTYSGQNHHDWLPDASQGHNDLASSLHHHGHDAWA
ncbi:MAG: hypothetical protein JWM36_434 [Hyphomicrobiales bacterium]|nr:hypothetical protein [Hyphomicrobiales bacterium]